MSMCVCVRVCMCGCVYVCRCVCMCVCVCGPCVDSPASIIQNPVELHPSPFNPPLELLICPLLCSDVYLSPKSIHCLKMLGAGRKGNGRSH